MALAAIDPQQNIVSRVANLPLVSSTYDMVSTAYITTKDNYPYLKSVCEIAEKGVKTITSVAMTSAMPIIQKLEPQIVVANNYACIGLDKIEERLPILNQPTDKVVANAKDVVVGAREAVTTTVTGAKETVAHTITGVVGKTKEAVQDSVEMTKSVVNGSINTVLGVQSRVVQMVSSGVDSALTKSETLVDQYLPLTEAELEKEAANVEGFEIGVQKPSYYVRLGSLSSKVRTRAYQQALNKVRDAKQKSQETISQLHYTVSLIEYARKNVNSANKKLLGAQEKLYQSWVEWKKNTGQNDGDDLHSAEHIESRTLAIARTLTQQLQTTCLTLVSSLQGLPQNVQDQVYSVGSMAGDVYQSFRSASSFQELSDSFIAASKGQLKKMKESLDDMMDYLVNNTPLNWLVPDFAITDLSSESDDVPDILDLDEEDQQDFSRTNGPYTAGQRAE
ncbi:perilipin-2 isoform X1 [Motacilla alba alba]|uniref:perilipin-2 isoform X1 n=1 Tax=Motacilla alba alba TaxID=1094192 RepID=UPI0018D58EC0|nr:perilipin-2 isoform X1 [Motacilla alba alba]XP_037979881.1 perilipin-2 isoform X1 [Motacilla alba alba]XP_037979882.1 perilipin-2 isoform X1 [Motacilla alba alba]